MGIARFRVCAQLDSAGGLQEGTVTIDRESGLVEIRPLRGRRIYRTTLAMMATAACRTIIYNEVMEQKSQKKRARRKA